MASHTQNGILGQGTKVPGLDQVLEMPNAHAEEKGKTNAICCLKVTACTDHAWHLLIEEQEWSPDAIALLHDFCKSVWKLL